MNIGLILLTLCLLCGCQASPSRQSQSTALGRLGTTVLGDGDETVLVLASIHGDEFAGTPIADRLIAEGRRRPSWLEGKTLVVVPIANPDGYAANTRGNKKGVDLNRNWPAGNFQGEGDRPLSEWESQAMFDLIERHDPTRILSIHQPLACIDYDGPGLELANAMAAECDLPVKKLGGRPGSMGSYLGLDRHIPIITLELRKNDHELSDTQLWDQYGDAVLTFIDGV